ncbi:MAG: hypothetical protein ACYC3F_16825 [Gemmatimonadaceae bacterium]
MSHRTLKGVRHGERTTYRKGCRCTRCCDVERTYQREKRQRSAPPSTRYVQRWEKPVLPVDDEMKRYRREKAAHAKRQAKALASVIAAAKAQLEREMSHALSVGRTGRPRKSAHIPCLSEAA